MPYVDCYGVPVKATVKHYRDVLVWETGAGGYYRKNGHLETLLSLYDARSVVYENAESELVEFDFELAFEVDSTPVTCSRGRTVGHQYGDPPCSECGWWA